MVENLTCAHNAVKLAVRLLHEAQNAYDAENENWSASATTSQLYGYLLKCQNDLMTAMKYWQQAGGRSATWGTYYSLLGYSTIGLSEEDKATSVFTTI
jgi:hypothetical protein